MSTTTRIQLVVGLGNPGHQYAATRHNVGAWCVEEIADKYAAEMRVESKFSGLFGVFNLDGVTCKLLTPTTYMNLSGQAVRAVASFYRIPPESILVVHDELDFEPGVARLKFGGKDNGHNGLRDIIAQLHTNQFHRLRLGIGRPANKNIDVADYVLSTPSNSDALLIQDTIARCLSTLPLLVAGNIAQATQEINAPAKT